MIYIPRAHDFEKRGRERHLFWSKGEIATFIKTTTLLHSSSLFFTLLRSSSLFFALVRSSSRFFTLLRSFFTLLHSSLLFTDIFRFLSSFFRLGRSFARKCYCRNCHSRSPGRQLPEAIRGDFSRGISRRRGALCNHDLALYAGGWRRLCVLRLPIISRKPWGSVVCREFRYR